MLLKSMLPNFVHKFYVVKALRQFLLLGMERRQDLKNSQRLFNNFTSGTKATARAKKILETIVFIIFQSNCFKFLKTF